MQQEAVIDEGTAVEAEQIKAHFAEGNSLNFAGAVVLTLVVYAVRELVPPWTWGPALLGLYLVTLGRTEDIRRFRRRPESHSTGEWIRRQTIYGGLSGACWALANTAMLSYLPTEYHLFIFTVATVTAASASARGFALHQPSSAYIVVALAPPTLWLMTVGDRVHGILAVMLCIFIPLTLSLGKKRHRVFVEAQRMRFRNEAMAKELLRQRDVAEQAQMAKGRFLAAASHDLRQPMQALSIFLDLLQAERHGGKTEELLGLTQQAVNSVNSLLNALLDISKLDAGAVTPNRCPVAVQDLFDDMAREFGPLAERKGLRLRIVGCSAAVDSDPVLLGQIVRNLVANALRYTPSGRVLVGCRRGPGTLRIEVIDTGIGIPADQHEAVFREFHQVGNQERNREQGLGLGLAIVERIARLLGHALTLRSRPGVGSCFAVTVPLAPATAGVAAGPEAAPAEGDLAGKRIIFIDDEEAIRVAMDALLHRWGCEVVVAPSAADALAAIDADPRTVDAVVSDMALAGGATGIEAIAELRQRCGGGLPAILVTGDTSQATLNAAKAAGLPTLHKPIRPARLRAVLAATLRGEAYA